MKDVNLKLSYKQSTRSLPTEENATQLTQSRRVVFQAFAFFPEYTRPRLLITEVKTAGYSVNTQQTARKVSFQLMLIVFKH